MGLKNSLDNEFSKMTNQLDNKFDSQPQRTIHLSTADYRYFVFCGIFKILELFFFIKQIDEKITMMNKDG
ncbi:hypothetical protein HanRHA438_Chr16g0757411 [Helianthus annuus]|nr:hypothetical protein HanHA300_Chr16g0608141 [Helianthus annuus]KAJ0442528.1 hypothetical protein HanIR_Chr16g0810341 [Helianthus annuus]KAJ0460265.1 hypothetical protein HanHA89_Chr16g0658701 [Helianthus annuus]KAJ0640703.1 hypothetical protein HanLR1_Chr16g0618661 [Helianthus annuus]KAJ0644626.1 hypothetical protein HanOQP8_Chr16g0614391 [Helianthus annuus]